MFMFDEDGNPGGNDVPPVEGNSGGDQNPSPQPAQTGPTFDPRAIATELHSVFQQNQPQRPPTEAEIAQARKDLRVFEISDEWVTRFNNADTQKQAFEQLRDGLMAQFATYTDRFVSERDAAILERMSPFEQHFAQQQNEALMTRMNTAHPGLDKLRPIVDKVIAHFQTSNARFPDEKSLFNAVVQHVEQVVGITQPGFKLSAGSANPHQPAQNQPGSLPRGASGSRGGGARTPAPANGGSRVAALLDA